MTSRNTESPAQPPPDTGTAWDELHLASGELRPHWHELRGCGKTHLVFGERCVRSRYARKRGSSGRSVQLHPSGEAGRSGTSVAQASGDGRPGFERVGGMVRSAV